jgi:uncharacterized membrane protein YphA (DoxX/SURF4 family)
MYKTMILDNIWLELFSRWLLGLVFIYASYQKILFPSDFAKIIYGYDLFPLAFINLMAIVLPFVELCFGLALVIGIFPRSAALILNGILLAFILALSINLIRGHEFDCGCFSSLKTSFASSTGHWIVRDIILLSLGLQVFFYGGFRKACLIRNLKPYTVAAENRQTLSVDK